MKIAVLLRGQLRFSEEGAHLFKKFVIDKFPQHEFEFFVSAPMRINFFPNSENKIENTAPRYNNVNLTVEETEKKIKFWPDVRQYHIQTEYEVFNIVKKIVLELVSDSTFYDWRNQHSDKFNYHNGMIDFTAPPVDPVLRNDFKTDFNHILYKNLCPEIILVNQTNEMMRLKSLFENYYTYYNISLCDYAITLHNLISQYYSFAKSFMVLKEYMSNNQYNPGLVWSTRTDVFHTFTGSGDIFEAISSQIDFLTEEKESNPIISPDVLINKGLPWINDYNLFSNVSSLDKILDSYSCEDILVNAMVRDKLSFFNIKFHPMSIQHTMWAKIFNTAWFYPYCSHSQQHQSGLIRFNFDSNAIMNMTGSLSDLEMLKQMSDEFSYPTDMKWYVGDDYIIKEFEYLSAN